MPEPASGDGRMRPHQESDPPRRAGDLAGVEQALPPRWPAGRLDPSLDRIRALTELLLAAPGRHDRPDSAVVLATGSVVMAGEARALLTGGADGDPAPRHGAPTRGWVGA